MTSRRGTVVAPLHGREGVLGSIPSGGSTNKRRREMESDFSDFTNGEVAQQVEQETENLRVADSISALSTWKEIDGGFVITDPNIPIVGVLDKAL